MIKSDRVEVIDFSGEKFSKYSIPCSVLLLLIFLLAVINVTLMFLFPRSLISTLMSLGIIAIFVLYYYYVATKNPGKIRKFSISSEEIELSVPDSPLFLIQCKEFDKIEVKLKSFNFKPYLKCGFHFINEQSEKKTFNFTLYDFPKKKVDHILILTKNYAEKLGKVFTAVKEKEISGIYQVENLNI